MGQVTVTIAGKVFRMACDDGQEAHLEGLAAAVDRKIGDLRGAFGEIGDQRLTVMAAITMADEASEQSRRIAALEREVEVLRDRQGELSRDVASQEQVLVDSVVRLAERVDRICEIVEGRAPEN